MTSLRTRFLLVVSTVAALVSLSAVVAGPAQATTRTPSQIVRQHIPIEAARP